MTDRLRQTVRLKGEPWIILFGPIRSKQPLLGYCHFGKRLIKVDPAQHTSDEQVVITLLHELNHAYNPGWKERHVEKRTSEIGRAMFRVFREWFAEPSDE